MEMDGSQQREQQSFGHEPTGRALFGLPSAFIHGFVSRQRYVLFTRAQKIICLHSFHSCHLCGARQSTMGLNSLGNKGMATKKEKKIK